MSTHHKLPANTLSVHRGVFGAQISPVLTIHSGDTVEVSTLSGNDNDLPDKDSGFIVSAEHTDVLAKVPRGEGPHFMTGPIAVAGAMPGDELVVEIVSVELAQDWGWNLILPSHGTLPEDFPQKRLLHVAIDRKRGVVKMPWGLELPATPFFGIIGVAPQPTHARLTSDIPGTFGGNIDNKHLVAGATLHLPVFNPGALLSIGDGHALQGDGEVCLTAIETNLHGTIRITVTKNTGLKSPWAETPTHVITMAFDLDLDTAARSAVRDMVRLARSLGNLSPADAYTLTSIAADVHVTQLVNVHKGVHVTLAKSALRI